MLLSWSHSDPRTVPRVSKHPRRLEHCWRFRYLRVTTVHPASLHALRSPGGELINQDSLPRYPSWSVSSSSSVQQPFSLVSSPSGASCSRSLTHTSLGHNLAGCPIPPHTKHVRPFPLPLAFPPLLPLPLPFSLGFSMALPASLGCSHGCDVPYH